MKIGISARRPGGTVFALGAIAATAAVALLLASAGSARVSAVTPAEGQYYRLNTVLQGVCEWTTTADGSHYPVVETYFQRWYHFAWSNAGELPRQGTTNCTERMEDPGRWRMRVFNPDGDHTIKIVGPFWVLTDWSKRPECSKNPATKVVAVSTPGGESTKLSALKGTHMYKYQQVTADQDVQLTFGDGSAIRMAKGSTYKVADCGPTDMGDRPVTFRQQLLIKWGPVWVTDPNKEAPKNLTTTQIALGIRATTYWVSFEQGVSTVTVEKGSVWVQRRSGSKLVGAKLIVKAGQTATVRGGGKLVVKKTNKSTPYPFSSWS
jgi:hypothetical protein